MVQIDSTAVAGVRVSFLEALESGVMVGDGAMGTMLQERGIPIDACLEKVNLERPGMVRAIHREYIDAGADFIQTNTFGGNRLRLAAYGLEGRVEEINRRAVQIAREAMAAAGRAVHVAGCVGPLGSEVSEDEARAIFGEQMEALAAEGVDLFVLQTFTALREVVIAVETVHKVAPGVPVVAEISFLTNRKTIDGADAVMVARTLQEAGADVLGPNCGDGPPQVLRVTREMARIPGLRLIAQPSAGRPVLVQRRVVYSASAEHLATYARRFVEAGASIVGGCCGTSPRHIAAMKLALEAAPVSHIEVIEALNTADVAPIEPRGLREKLASGHFVVSVELDPPRGFGVNRTIEAARMMAEAGADCVNVGDSPMAEVRMSALTMAAMLRDRADVEPILHCSTRDRNLMALQSDMMGAHAWGLRNVLCIKGDPHALGKYTNAAAVWDVNALGLMRILKGFNAGHDALDNPVTPPARFFIGAAVNPAADDLNAEVRLVKRKVDSGAEFLISQAAFDADAVERLVEKLGPGHPPVILGIWPVHSLKQAQFLDERIVPIPEHLFAAHEKAGAADGERLGIEMAMGLIERVTPLVQGIYFIPSFGRFSGITELVVQARELADARV